MCTNYKRDKRQIAPQVIPHSVDASYRVTEQVLDLGWVDLVMIVPAAGGHY